MNFTKLKKAIITILCILTLGSIGTIINNNPILIHAKMVHYYPKTKYYQRTVYTTATKKIRYYKRWHKYWTKRYNHIDKLYAPVYYQNTPYEHKISRLDNYYYDKVVHCDNNESTWSDIKYAIYKYPVNHKSARHLIWRLYKYNIRKHNDQLNDYLSFCHYYHIKPKYKTQQWKNQLLYFTYEE